MDEEALFRKRLKQFVLAKYGSLDRFYLETEFSKGHLSQILSGKRSPSIRTVAKIARELGIPIAELFMSEEQCQKHTPIRGARRG